jgi:hypothetical protein
MELLAEIGVTLLGMAVGLGGARFLLEGVLNLAFGRRRS